MPEESTLGELPPKGRAMPDTMPPRVQEQLEAFEARTDSPGRLECERLYPELINFIRERISLVGLIRASGLNVEPLSPDAPDVYVVRGGCPFCGDNVFIKELSDVQG